jgi:long-chain acyl-CoA synthetase
MKLIDYKQRLNHNKLGDMEIKRTFDFLENYKLKYANHKDALAVKRNRTWEYFSSEDYLHKVNQFSCGLLALGFNKGDKIATITNNRPEWNFVDMGMSQIGVVHVPVYPTISAEEYQHILSHSEARIIILSDKVLYKKIKPIADLIPEITAVYTFDPVEGALSWDVIMNAGQADFANLMIDVEKIKGSISENDLVSIIYTSGTTGLSKGVMLSHKNFVHNAIATSEVQPLDHRHKFLSFLPLSHVYERMMNYHLQYLGIRIYYAENMGTIVDDIKQIHAEGFNTVPRLLEKIFDKIISKGKDLKGAKKMIFFWAVNLGLRYELNGANGWLYEQKLKLAKKLIFKKWNEALGGKVQVIVSGGSSLQPRLARVFWAAGLKVIEGYGLTETSPVITVNYTYWPKIRFGTVGLPIDQVEVKLAEDGEILYKGPGLMMGYFKDTEATAAVIDENGWFHTGDVGVFEDGKFLKITDRKKEIFKNSAGKYIAPQVIENKMKESFLIEQAMVVGANEKYCAALISPNFNFLHDWSATHKIHYRDNFELVRIPQVIELFDKEIDELNQKLAAHEQIKKFKLVCDDWSPAGGELSPTLKLRRKFLYAKYNHLLEEIYARSVEQETIDEVLNKAKK